MATVHFIQQGKGGVGKSMIASILYQVLLLLGKKVAAFDTDPVNATLAGFKEFEVTCLDILKNGDIDPRQFDTLIDTIMEQKPETHVILSWLSTAISKKTALSACWKKADTPYFFIRSSRAGRPLEIRFSACVPWPSAFRQRPLWSG